MLLCNYIIFSVLFDLIKQDPLPSNGLTEHSISLYYSVSVCMRNGLTIFDFKYFISYLNLNNQSWGKMRLIQRIAELYQMTLTQNTVT